ncbi:MAG: hypothetical protein IT335_16215, partial [Thermomicrobiales bacterium]|nr:hypothetical protein [Thermomicrobiales bacterium]
MPRFIADQTYTELFVAGSLDSLLGSDSLVRVLWATLVKQDLAPFEAVYRNDAIGRPALDPRRLIAVWLLGLLRGVTSSVAL